MDQKYQTIKRGNRRQTDLTPLHRPHRLRIPVRSGTRASVRPRPLLLRAVGRGLRDKGHNQWSQARSSTHRQRLTHGNGFTEQDVLQPLVDISVVARLMSLLNEKRPHGSLAQLMGRRTNCNPRYTRRPQSYRKASTGGNDLPDPNSGSNVRQRVKSHENTCDWWRIIHQRIRRQTHMGPSHASKTQVQGCMKPPKYKGSQHTCHEATRETNQSYHSPTSKNDRQRT